MALDARELERNKVFGSAIKKKKKKEILLVETEIPAEIMKKQDM